MRSGYLHLNYCLHFLHRAITKDSVGLAIDAAEFWKQLEFTTMATRMIVTISLVAHIVANPMTIKQRLQVVETIVDYPSSHYLEDYFVIDRRLVRLHDLPRQLKAQWDHRYFWPLLVVAAWWQWSS